MAVIITVEDFKYEIRSGGVAGDIVISFDTLEKLEHWLHHERHESNDYENETFYVMEVKTKAELLNIDKPNFIKIDCVPD